MEPIRHIMVATDGSELSLKAAAFGGEMARALGATVSIVMVLDERRVIPEVWGAVDFPGIGGLETISTESARRATEDNALSDGVAKTSSAVGALDSGVEAVVLWGHEADALCDYARDHEVDIIVLGSHAGPASSGQYLVASVFL